MNLFSVIWKRVDEQNSVISQSVIISSGTTWTLPDDWLGKQTEHLDSLADDEQPECTHDWLDTGMRKTWCRHCEAPAVLNAAGKWEEVKGS